MRINPPLGPLKVLWVVLVTISAYGTGEICFLAVHGFYHLLGYDHMSKEDEEIMFKKQEEVLEEYGITR